MWRVRLYEPGAGRYWRIEWQEHGRCRQTSGGTTKQTAAKKAKQVLADLDRGTHPLGKTKVQEVKPAGVVCDGYRVIFGSVRR